MSNEFNVQELLRDMLSVAAQEIVRSDWAKIQQMADFEFREILARVQEIQRLLDEGQISEEKADRFFHNQVALSHDILGTVRVLRKLEVQRVLRAVLNVIGGTVNNFVGFELIEVED